MFATSIKLAKKYDYLAPRFKQAYDWLDSHDVTKMEDGRYDIGEGVFAMVQRYTTLPFEKARFECHNEYFDIQYLAAGHESFGVALRSDLEVEEERLADDVIFYKTPKFYTPVNLKAGDLVAVPPEEAHQPRAAYNGQPEAVVKVVVKVKV
ncbi:MAG: YhcH/YjgK/YiaL family protein [Succinivibrionaceae bacterium]|nr:YhcH/YjgK/YiaL family protein [Succinivibrionaceae bacterium]